MEPNNCDRKIGAIKYVRGFPIPSHPMHKENKTELAMDYRARDGDVVLVAYPKTGSTWLQAIVWHLINKGKKPYDVNLVPRIERDGPEAVDAMPGHRFYKQHLPFSCININDKAKYIYIYRRPDDTFMSYYHFAVEMSNMEFDTNSLFGPFIEGKVPFGNYFDHVLSAYERGHEKYLYFMSYEDLKKDTRGKILDLAKFLGEEYVSALLSEKGALLEDILQRTSFEYMKKNCTYVKPVSGGIQKEINFYRKGVVGDGRKSLLPEQINVLKAVINEKMKDTEFIQLWDI